MATVPMSRLMIMMMMMMNGPRLGEDPLQRYTRRNSRRRLSDDGGGAKKEIQNQKLLLCLARPLGHLFADRPRDGCAA